MQRITENVVVLDAWASVAAGYRRHAPNPCDFHLGRPYGQAEPIEEGDGGGEGAAGPRRCRKRRRKGESGGGAAAGYQPNPREQEAAHRHAAVAPLLIAAAQAVQGWLAASGASHIRDALGVALPPLPELDAMLLQPGAGGRRQTPPLLQLQPLPTTACGASGGGGGGGSSCCGSEGSGMGEEASGEPEPDYPTLAAMRHVLRPKLELLANSEPPRPPPQQRQQQQQQQLVHPGSTADGRAAGAAAAGTAAAHAPPLTHAARASCNLFNSLISTGGEGGSGSENGQERWARAAGHPVLLPPNASFLLSDVKQLAQLLPASAGGTDGAAAAGGYHCIVLDPPWENKSVKRSAKYAMLPSRNLLGLPLRQLMHQDGCLVALWITNRERHLRFINSELLPAWGLRQVATWHWLKVTDRGETVGRLDIEHRRPYESLLLCTPEGGVAAGFTPPPAQLVLSGVPPRQHSRKPHLDQLLRPLLPPNPRCIEMFARELFPGWTSWGNEALKFQSRRYFVALQRKGESPLAGGMPAGGG